MSCNLTGPRRPAINVANCGSAVIDSVTAKRTFTAGDVISVAYTPKVNINNSSAAGYSTSSGGCIVVASVDMCTITGTLTCSTGAYALYMQNSFV